MNDINMISTPTISGSPAPSAGGAGLSMGGKGLIGAGIAGLFSLAGSIYNTKKTIAMNKEMFRKAWKKRIDFWHMRNKYNSPAQQMKRLKAAGLNPNLVYGSNAPSGIAANLPSGEAPHLESRIDIASAVRAYQEQKMITAQYQNIKADTLNTIADTKIKGKEAAIKAIVEDIKSASKKDRISQAAAKTKLMKLNAGLKKLGMRGKKFTNQIKQAKATLAQAGLSLNDSIWLRVTAVLAKQFGLLPKGFNLLNLGKPNFKGKNTIKRTETHGSDLDQILNPNW